MLIEWLAGDTSGIVATTGESLQFIRDEAERITQVTGIDGSVVQYAYGDRGNLSEVRYLATGEINRYGYDEQNRLAIVNTELDKFSLDYTAAELQISTITADLGTAYSFNGQEIAVKGGESYLFSFTASELNSTATGFVW